MMDGNLLSIFILTQVNMCAFFSLAL